MKKPEEFIADLLTADDIADLLVLLRKGIVEYGAKDDRGMPVDPDHYICELKLRPENDEKGELPYIRVQIFLDRLLFAHDGVKFEIPLEKVCFFFNALEEFHDTFHSQIASLLMSLLDNMNLYGIDQNNIAQEIANRTLHRN